MVDGSLEAMADSLRARGYEVEQQGDLVVARRGWFKLRWLATHLTVFVVARRVEHVTLQELTQHIAVAKQVAASKWGGMRGMQMGYCTVPVLLGASLDEGAKALLGGRWQVEFSRFFVPAAVVAGRVFQAVPPRFVGIVYHGHVRTQVAALGTV